MKPVIHVNGLSFTGQVDIIQYIWATLLRAGAIGLSES
jgi:serine/threonine protein kinase